MNILSKFLLKLKAKPADKFTYALAVIALLALSINLIFPGQAAIAIYLVELPAMFAFVLYVLMDNISEEMERHLYWANCAFLATLLLCLGMLSFDFRILMYVIVPVVMFGLFRWALFVYKIVTSALLLKKQSHFYKDE